MDIQRAPKILILGNQMIIAADISLQFTKLGYDVMGIHTRSEDAMKTVAHNRPDMVLITNDLTGKINVLETAKNLWNTFRIPIVLLGTHTDCEAFRATKAVQPYTYIAKPFEKEDLQRGVETTLDRLIAEGLWQE